MIILAVFTILFLITSLRWYLWACEDFSQRKILAGWVFLIGSFVWMGFGGALAFILALKAQVT